MRSLTVVGDVLLDCDVTGRVQRICPDAPVPVFELERRGVRPGGAALAAWLAASRGVPTTLVASFGDDPAAEELLGLLAAGGVTVVDLGDDGPTVVKTRLRVDGRTVLRVDQGGGPGELADVELRDAAAACEAASAVLVSDYGGGITSRPGVRELVARCARRSPVVWDPHPRGATPVPGVHLVTPNAAETAAVAPPIDGRPPGVHARRGLALRDKWGVRAVAVTCGDRGAVLVGGAGAPLVVPVDRPSSGDTCGAGDAFAVSAACALADGAVLSEAVIDAVAAAATFVGRGGASSIAATNDRGSALDLRDPRDGAGEDRRPVVVAAGGCFDVLHAGHVQFLRHARSLGDRLVVLLNSDSSVRRLKGHGRPINQQADRAAVVGALESVDEVVVFDEDTPEVALARVRPNLFVKGGDYASRELPEAEAMAAWGGDVVVVPYLPGRSTSQLLSEVSSVP